MRQGYLLDAATIGTLKTVGLVAMYGCGIAAVLSASVSLVCLVFLAVFGFYPAVGSVLAACTFVFGSTAVLARSVLNVACESESSLVYIPPAPPVSALPAEEVLLRGSHGSLASSEELLRAVGREATAQEELLRATTGGNAE